MPKTSKVKKKVTKVKTKTKTVIKAKPKTVSKPKEISKGPIKISKTYIPKETEKYMCEKHKVFFRMKLQEWKKELVKKDRKLLKESGEITRDGPSRAFRWDGTPSCYWSRDRNFDGKEVFETFFSHEEQLKSISVEKSASLNHRKC